MKNTIVSGFLLISLMLTSCGDDDLPPLENEGEVISHVDLTFQPVGGGNSVTVSAFDPDGEGPQDIEIQGVINLLASTDYILHIEILDLGGDSITEEIREEKEEHQFFFEFDDNVFISPDGTGNINDHEGAIGYQDFDVNNNPVGLTTSWSTSDSPASGTFQVILKHQPDIKSASSTSADGETDLDLIWEITVE